MRSWTDPSRSGAERQRAHHLVEAHRRAGATRPRSLDDHGRWTFEELSEACGRAAAGLHRLGVRPGDRVAVALPDGREAVAALIGAMRLGAIAVPLDRRGSGRATAAILEDCTPRVVVDRPGMLDGATTRPVAPVRPEDPR